MSNDLLRMEDLVNNPTARVPVCMCLDVSGSMNGEPIHELNEGVRMFYNAIQEDETALYAAEICIVTFGGDGACCIADFSNLERQPNAPTLDASGRTPMGEAVWDLICLRSERMSIRARGWIITNLGLS